MAQDTAQSAFGYADWNWLNPPAAWTPGEDAVDITTAPGSDFWVTTHYGYVTDSGHALLRPVPGEFTLAVTFTGDYREQYDQAGLMLWADDRNWLKTGIEYVDGRHQISAVVTRDVSDWNVAPLGPSLRVEEPGSPRVEEPGEGPDAPAALPVSISIRRAGDSVTIEYGTGDAAPQTLLRLAYFPPGVPAQAGPMCASPVGPGFTTRFSALRFLVGEDERG